MVGFHGCFSKRYEKEEDQATDAFIESTLDGSSDDELKSEVSNTKQLGLFKPTNVKDVITVVQFCNHA